MRIRKQIHNKRFPIVHVKIVLLEIGGYGLQCRETRLTGI